ncbi:hypothetical protein [Streptomyces sp. ISL-100]|uniref:hypothetical protein n=1 Tax=Streptomyces sp. ISL-100 TaxID=2819173 RepID=UPI001BEC7559|nr:hypothetical protein [Streptomyces sp. ISL-100]MBT2396523.1 hypothetical protein [Streptomyces sp. ISL-100]
MADERYEWLDKDAAERLLRGEPVGPVGDHARAQAERLSAALDGVARAGGHEAGELPGEAAALAAFRKARAAAPDTFSTSTVRIGRKVSVPVRWARPVRLGLAGALAGFALGGVAVAAGTGVLPSPFGRGGDPAPASTVSAAATPQPLTSGSTTGEPGDTGEPTPGATGTTGGEHETPGGGNGNGAGDGETGGTHESSPGSDTGLLPTYPGWTGDGPPGTAPGDGSGPGSGTGDWYRKTAKACQDYRAGNLTPDRERRLEAAAKGADRVERFCDRVLDGSADGTGAGGKQGGGEGDGSSGGGNGDGGDKDDDKGDGKGDGSDGGQDAPGGISRAVPPISYTLPPSPTVEPSATVGASPQPH